MEPTQSEVYEQEANRPTNSDAMANRQAKTASNTRLTGAGALTVRQSIVPCLLVTMLFFLWGFAYGLLDTLNAKFQVRTTALDVFGQIASLTDTSSRALSTSLTPRLVVCRPLTLALTSLAL